MKRYIWGIIYGLLLTAFTVYVILDTFVIARVYMEVPPIENDEEDIEGKHQITATLEPVFTPNPTPDLTAEPVPEMTPEPTAAPTPQPIVITDNSYSDENITITITEYRELDTTIYVADVKLSSAEYLKTAFAKGVYGKNVTEKTSETAADNNAILAINGDYYGTQEKGYVVRNGVLYRDEAVKGREALVIYKDGSFEVISEKNVTAEAVLAEGAMQILSFGPALVVGSQISVTEDEEVGKAMTSNPRTAIGVVDELHYLLVVSDGRTNESEGLTLYQLAEFMQTLGATTAYNLDGGGSSTMYFNGEVINNPTTNGRSIKERSVSDIVYIGY